MTFPNHLSKIDKIDLDGCICQNLENSGKYILKMYESVFYFMQCLSYYDTACQIKYKP